jgi:hypothetical protein
MLSRGRSHNVYSQSRISQILVTREYWMNNRGPGFLAVV